MTISVSAVASLCVVALGVSYVAWDSTNTAIAEIDEPPVYCNPNATWCWPTPEEISALSEQLDPSAERVLSWPGGESPRVGGVPRGSPNQQPLFGAGINGMAPVYSWGNNASEQACFEPATYKPLMCLMGTRNVPLEHQPGVIVWPLTAQHVQIAVRFAKKHNMCVMVAGSSHEFLNRHTCPWGVFIRTSLMRDATFLPDVGPDGAFRFGPGTVFSEAHKFSSDHDRFVASGYASTVGIVGWSIGGGHGPFSPSVGLGVDNIVAVELVDANGDHIVVDAQQHSDLYWAVRGGGGSVWGVITSITVRAHRIPAGGFTSMVASYAGSMCTEEGKATLNATIDAFRLWALALGPKWAGRNFFVSSNPKVSPQDPAASACRLSWNVTLDYIFQGPQTDPEYVRVVNSLTAASVKPMEGPVSTGIAKWWDRVKTAPLEPIFATVTLRPTPRLYSGGIGTVLISREMFMSDAMKSSLVSVLATCAISNLLCGNQGLYLDLTGNVGSLQPDDVAISRGLRTSLVHWLSQTPHGLGELNKFFYPLGENSYFSESSYEMDNWRERYWGRETYEKLRRIKQKYDPTGLFWCRHCVDHR